MKEKYKYLGKNTFIFGISSFGTKFLSFFLVPLYTSVLTTEAYGVADIITTTATLLIYIFTINIADAVLRFALEKEEYQNEILGYGLRVLTYGSLILIFCLGLTWKSNIVQWKTYYYLFVFLYYFFTALYQILTNYLRAIDQVIDVAVAGIVSAFSMIVGNILFLLVIKIGVIGYLTAMTIGPFIGAFYCIRRIRLPIGVYIKEVCDYNTQKAMRAYCTPLIFNNIALWINAFLDKYFITAMCGVAQNGIYAVSYKIPTILSMCYTVFSQAWNLSAIKEFDKEDKDGFFSETYSLYNAAITMVCSALILLNIPIAKFLFAKDFFEAWNYSSVLLISVMFNALTSFLGSIFSAVKNSKVIATTTLISALTNIILNVALIPIWGVQGAAIATAVCYAVMWIVRLVWSKKYIKLRINLHRDIFVYLLLVGQVILEHIKGHCYLGQTIILIVIVIVYRDYIRKIVIQFIRKFLSKTI